MQAESRCSAYILLNLLFRPGTRLMNIYCMKRLGLAVIFCIFLVPAICRGSDDVCCCQISYRLNAGPLVSPDDTKADPGSKPIWIDGVGSGFQRNTFQIGAAIGAGTGTKVFGTTRNHDLAMAAANIGWIFTGLSAPGRWYNGNFELVTELFGGGQFHPDGGYLAGLTPFIRYNFATLSRWIPFVEAGVGLSVTDIDIDLNGTFQFNLQGGAGVNYFFKDTAALTAQYRWFHLSNAGMKQPNNGVNTQMFLIGISWFF